MLYSREIYFQTDLIDTEVCLSAAHKVFKERAALRLVLRKPWQKDIPVTTPSAVLLSQGSRMNHCCCAFTVGVLHLAWLKGTEGKPLPFSCGSHKGWNSVPCPISRWHTLHLFQCNSHPSFFSLPCLTTFFTYLYIYLVLQSCTRSKEHKTLLP